MGEKVWARIHPASSGGLRHSHGSPSQSLSSLLRWWLQNMLALFSVLYLTVTLYRTCMAILLRASPEFDSARKSAQPVLACFRLHCSYDK